MQDATLRLVSRVLGLGPIAEAKPLLPADRRHLAEMSVGPSPIADAPRDVDEIMPPVPSPAEIANGHRAALADPAVAWANGFRSAIADHLRSKREGVCS